MRTIIVTGVAGFIGFSVTRTLLSQGYKVLGIDNMARDGELLQIMKLRLNNLLSYEHFVFVKADLCNCLNLHHDEIIRLSSSYQGVYYYAKEIGRAHV